MCHHTRDGTREQWDLVEATEEDEEDDPSFVQEEREVDVELLDADDD
jgi:hypothetical protein